MNLLIIDDEPLILNKVKEDVLGMELDFERVDTAHSAAEARKLLSDNYYEIFLCDIVMPEEDGITFAKWALSRYPGAKFIFLTAHADFEYMKEAIAMQSFDYVLQPVDPEELRSVIQRASMQVRLEWRNEQLKATGSFYEDHEADILDGNATRYLTGLSSDEAYLRRLVEKRLEESAEGRLFLPFFVQVLKTEREWREDERSLLRSIYYNITDEILSPLGTRNVLILRSDRQGNFITLITCPGSGEDAGADGMPGGVPELAAVLERLETMRILFAKLVRTEIAIYCGRFVPFGGLREVCGVITADISNTADKVSRVYQAGQLSAGGAEGYAFSAQLGTWEALLARNRILDFRSSIFHYLDFYTAGGTLNRDFLLKFHESISTMILGYMASNNISSAEIFNEEVSYYDFVYSWSSVEELKRVIAFIIERLYSMNGAEDEDHVESAIRYIRQHLEEDILVGELADRLGMNPGYLTRIFKKKTGLNLKRFIDNEKMSAAKLLLTTTNLPVTIISEHVGYANYSNFSRSFRQLVGCTPTEYRESGGEETV